jgi:hypothetical protein
MHFLMPQVVRRWKENHSAKDTHTHIDLRAHPVMCHQTTCSTCGKITWAGCGFHVDSALRGVPKEALCVCGTAGPPSTARQVLVVACALLALYLLLLR